MRSFLPISSLALLLSACGSQWKDTAHLKGAPHEFDAVCATSDGDTSFRIYEGQGLLQSINFPGVSYSCSRGDATAAPEVQWACVEKNGGNSRLEVRIHKGTKYVKVEGVGVLACF